MGMAPFSVIPAHAGIQKFHAVTKTLDPAFTGVTAKIQSFHSFLRPGGLLYSFKGTAKESSIPRRIAMIKLRVALTLLLVAVAVASGFAAETKGIIPGAREMQRPAEPEVAPEDPLGAPLPTVPSSVS